MSDVERPLEDAMSLARRGRMDPLRTFRRRLFGVLAYTLALTAVGTLGFVQLSGWSFSDAVYMTIITLSAVGYEEVRPLSDTGRAFTAFLLAGGITGMGLWFALITSALVEMDLGHVFRIRRTMKNLQKLTDHIIVCGAGRTGRQVVKELVKSRVPYVVIEHDPDRAEQIRELDEGALVLEADATHDETLVTARIGTAHGLVAALSADTDNLFVCLSSRDLQPNLNIVARAFDEQTMSKLYKAGADHVISPNITGGARMASMLLRPQVMTFLDVVMRGEGLSLLLEEVEVPADSSLRDLTLEDAHIPQKTGLIVIAIRHDGEARARTDHGFVYNPGPQERIRAGDVLIVLGRTEQVDQLRAVVAE